MEKLVFSQIAQRAYEFNIKGRKQGFAGLADDIDAERIKNHDIFETGIKLISEGVDCENINKILTNKISMEHDASLKQLKIIQKEAVLCIQKKYNSWLLLNVLFSYTGENEKEETKKMLKNKIFTEYFSMYYEV